MRHKRAKQNRRTLQYFERIASFHPPYFILIDGPFLSTMIKFKIVDDLSNRLATLLSHSEVRLCVLSSTVQELERLNAASPNNSSETTLGAAIQWCKTRGNCTILSSETAATTTASANDATTTTTTTTTKQRDKTKVPPETVEGLSHAAKQLFAFVAQDPRFFVASQDADLLSSLRQNRNIPVPIIRLSRTVLLLESPNYHHLHHHGVGKHNTRSSTDTRNESKLTPAEKELVGMISRQEQQQPPLLNKAAAAQRRPQKAKGPNPLSCKPKKRKVVEDAPSAGTKKRTRRKKSSLPQNETLNNGTTDE